jgi:3-oxoacyl-[acyl-carrier protein] reductase
MIDPALEDSVVVVTGANNPHGIGVGVAKAFAGQGAHVFLHYFRSPVQTASAPSAVAAPGKAFYDAQQTKTPDDVLETIRARGGHAHAWEADLSDPASAASLFDEAERVLGPVEILVNNAAHSEHDTFIPSGANLRDPRAELATGRRPARVTAESFDRHFAVNTRAVALLTAEFARRHVDRGARRGRVINVSTAGAYVFPSEVSYGASKLAMETYTRSAAAELGQFGITVNAVSLGPVQTGWIPPALESALLSTIPLGRIGSPEEVADVIVFLASEQARWVSGQTIFVGGGHGM